jgi:Uncharacterised nucleotidyltransferase
MANSDSRSRKGKLVARALAGSWRSFSLPSFDLSAAELDEVTPLLYGSGAAALGWWRLRNTNLQDESSAAVLQQAYRLLALQSAIHEQKLEKVFRLLRQASVEAVLAKGWAAARLYPDGALRPYGDFDLLVRPDQFKTAEEVLSSPEASDCWVDLHKHFSEVNDRSVDELFSRATSVPLGQEHVRILSVEDHLALLSIHLLKHGAWRPVWLCDIGAAVESVPPNFSWDICLGHNSTRAGWIICAIGLAERILHADISALPIASRAKETPAWLFDSVLTQWSNPFAINQPPMNHSAPLASYLKHPLGIFRALRERWPNPILATVSVNGNFNDLPRLPYQVGNWALRASQFLIELPARSRSEQS